jgi:hypothetical protein
VTPAQAAGQICGTDQEEERQRIRAIVRRGEELGVPAMAQALAYETAVSVELALRLLAQAAGLPIDGERQH